MSAAHRAVRTATSLGLMVCNVSLGDLLLDQIAAEAQKSRLISAYQVLLNSANNLQLTCVKMLTQIKQPPELLSQVLDAAMILLRPGVEKHQDDAMRQLGRIETSKDTLENAGEIHGLSWRALDPLLIQPLMKQIDVDAVSDEQLRALNSALASIEYETVRERFGFASYVWSWVCAVAVIAGSTTACLPFEKREVIRVAQLAGKRRLPHHSTLCPRSCQGSPITGRPCYTQTATAHMCVGEASSSAENVDTRAELPFGPRWAAVALRISKERSCGIASSTLAKRVSLTAEAAKVSDGTTVNSCCSPTDLEPLKFLGAGAYANVFMCRDKKTGTVRCCWRPRATCISPHHALSSTQPHAWAKLPYTHLAV